MTPSSAELPSENASALPAPTKPRRSKETKGKSSSSGPKPPTWQSLLDGAFRSDLAARASAMLEAPPTESAKLTSGELKDRAKLAAKKAKSNGEDHSMSRWVAAVSAPLVVVRPEHAPLFDAEDCVLAAMRSRRNAVFWPWLIAAGLRPVDIATVDSADVPPQFRAACGEAFLRLATLPPGACDAATGAAPATLRDDLAKSFMAAACNAVYPGSRNVAAAFVTEELQLSSVTADVLQSACAARAEFMADGVTTAKPPVPLKPTKKNPTPLSDPAMTFPLFCALMRAIAEPVLPAPRGSQSESAGASLLKAVEELMLPAALSADAMRGYVAVDGATRTRSGTGSTSSGKNGAGGSFVRRRISVASAAARASDAAAAGGDGKPPRAHSELPPRSSAAENSMLPSIGGKAATPSGVFDHSKSVGDMTTSKHGAARAGVDSPLARKPSLTVGAGRHLSTNIAANQPPARPSALPPIAVRAT
eukprot:CAMPEP_0174853116 /NCGR_PEP_ID=MMETSP1114-20130205/27367_1 /TAXON_ID=312471 /ORGANISM="Neobodo designis, Strain CCAP 1951/1" /LENGTH=476 /DNA_ID=CAMNT_0016087737 /DNA_START=61 /DNA_END=1494 /DNA_ORIENTATION=-